MKTGHFGEYAEKGDYHIDLDPNWSYLPVYLAKMDLVRRFLDRCDPASSSMDLGCGEGALVNEYRQRGLDITGLDMNYESKWVRRGSLPATGLPDAAYDTVLCLDVLEHLDFSGQKEAVSEIARIIRPGGIFLLTVPNLAHFASRLSFLVRGKLIRTSSIDRHPGDRPVMEYLELLKPWFHIRTRRGIFPTFPLLSLLTLWKPSKSIWLHRLANRWLAYPDLCFLNAIFCERTV